ncbi:MAG: ribulose 1,5-bisphosphate carboxylase [Caldilineales bacterium]|nr:ribulose 1,5-bisphosphate carboxylase [Caldilineales bacterium]
MIFPKTSLNLSGERFGVRYRIVAGDENEARARAHGICLEQTVEVPDELLADDDIRAEVVGRIEDLRAVSAGRFEVEISYAVETSAFELTQLLNVVFGNTAMQPGIRVLHLDLPDGLLRRFPGPRFGQDGIRDLLDVHDRSLLCTALKPVGLSASDLADLAYQIALGGIDIIKEDHGFNDQPFAPFRERVERCAEAIARANRQSGYRCLYAPHVTAPADQVSKRAHEAKSLGASALMIAPGLAGWDAVRMLAADDDLALPILSHPAWLGTFVLDPDQGVSHEVIFGQLPRLAGADATIFVNYGGRFTFSQDDCAGIVAGAARPMGDYPTIFPIPSGGMDLSRLPEMYEFYGRDGVFLIAGGLYAHGPDLLQSSREFRRAVEKLSHQ